MYRRTFTVQVDAGVCRRLARLRRQTGTSIEKLVNSILRRHTDDLVKEARGNRNT